MSGLTKDTKLIQYGSGDGNQPESYPVGANQQLYSGAVALVSGSGSTTAGYLKNAATPGTSDYVVGMLGEPEGGVFGVGPCFPVAGTTDGSLWAQVRTGSFFFQSGTGSDLLSATTNGKTVYYGGENATGPIACAVVGTPARPVLGTQLPQDPGIAGGSSPGANYWPIIVRPDLGRP